MFDKKPAPTTTVPLTLETARAFLKAMEDPEKNTQCEHCRGIHDRACPRVKRIVKSPAGQIIEVEFFKEWNDTGIVWPEECAAIVLEAEANA